MAELSQALPFPEDNDAAATGRRVSGTTSETTGGGREPIKWVVVRKTMGYLPAQIMAERLKSDGIPARASQEGAGRALGLTVGILGEGRVLVPEEFEALARRILDEAEAQPIVWDDDDEDDDPS